jgi:putative transposase
MSSRSENDRYRPDTGAKEIGGIPPPCRNHLEPTAGDTPACTAASWLDRPRAIASQKRTRSTRRAVDGRPGDHIWPRIALILCCRLPTPIPHHLRIEVLRRPVESAQYTSLAFGRRLQQAGLVASMGTIGDALDNAVAESFFATLECELLDRHVWATRAGLRTAVFDFIEVFYNRQRRHSTLDYLTPLDYEHQHRSPAPAA